MILLVIDKVIMLHNQNQKDKRKEKDNLILSVMFIHKNEFNSIKLLWNQKQIFKKINKLKCKMHLVSNKRICLLSNSVMDMKTNKSYLTSKENNWWRSKTKKNKSKSMNRELLNNSKIWKIDQHIKLSLA